MRKSFSQGMACHIWLYDTLMQGKKAVQSIIEAWNFFHKMDPLPDLLILARGGGSLEDLAAFNDETLVRTLAQSRIPFISAIGHETDVSLVDHVADVRASTPTAAAQRAVPRWSWAVEQVNEKKKALQGQVHLKLHRIEMSLLRAQQSLERVQKNLQVWQMRLMQCGQSLQAQVLHHFQGYEKRLSLCAHVLPRLVHIQPQEASLERCRLALVNHMAQALKKKDYDFKLLAQRLESLSFKSILGRGFVLTLSPCGQILKTREQAQKTQRFTLRFQDGEMAVECCGQENKDLSNP